MCFYIQAIAIALVDFMACLALRLQDKNSAVDFLV